MIFLCCIIFVFEQIIRHFFVFTLWIILLRFVPLSHFCRTCKRYHKQDARANEGSASRIKPASSTHDGGSQTHPNRERGYNKPFTPCPAGNMGLTPTPCGHSRECPAQTKRRNFPEQIKRQSTSPAQSPLWTVFLYAWFFSLIRSKVLSRLFAAAASAD